MRLLFLFFLVFISACVSDPRIEKMESGLKVFDSKIPLFLKNKNVEQMSEKLGFPQEERLIAGKKYLVWSKTFNVPFIKTNSQTYRSQNGTASGTTTSTEMESMTCKLVVELDSNQNPLKYEFDGNKGACYRYGAYLGFIKNEID